MNACVEYERAVREVRKIGQVVKTKDRNAIQSPFLGIMNRQALLISRFGAELGFSPAARVPRRHCDDVRRRTESQAPRRK